ncbi:MAG: hypothetical protein ABS46_14805 [Cytophagaceae bacterium SCN 52-12]|nr:MAG: hypothetical protein ABS46_14805 [Cytophagaceae bacterium SCN 52-12]
MDNSRSDNRFKKLIVTAPVKTLLFFMLSLFLSCQSDDEILPEAEEGGTITIETAGTESKQVEGNTGTAANAEDLVENSTFSGKVTIRFGTTVSISNPFEGKGVEVTETNGDVTVSATIAEIEYELSGTTTDGSLKIYSDKKFRLSLSGVSITNPDGPAINIQSGKRAFIVLAQDSDNQLTDGSSYKASGSEDMKGAFFSEGQLIFSGGGKLSVRSNYAHAIASDDYIRIIDAAITVAGAVKDGLHANDAVIIDGGSLDIASTDDGIQCEEGYIVINDGTIRINSTGKAITASYDTDNTIDPYLTINGGSITIDSKDEGIESKSILTINGGTISVKATDDGINAGKFIYINGGDIYVNSTSNDGIDSNGPITITGGKILAIGAQNPEGGIDCDRSTFKITGGLVLGLGGNTSSPTASVSTQYSVIMSGSTAGQIISLLAADNTEALTFLVPVSRSTMLFSSPKLKAGQTYSLYTGGTVTGGDEFSGIYTSGSYEPGTKSSTSFTTTGMVTSTGGSTGPGR